MSNVVEALRAILFGIISANFFYISYYIPGIEDFLVSLKATVFIIAMLFCVLAIQSCLLILKQRIEDKEELE